MSKKTKKTTMATEQDIKEDIHDLLAMHRLFLNILNKQLKNFKYGEENVKTNN